MKKARRTLNRCPIGHPDKSVFQLERTHGIECAAAGTAECGVQRFMSASRLRLPSASDKALRSITSTCPADAASAGYDEKVGFNHKSMGMASAGQASTSIFAGQGTAESRSRYIQRAHTNVQNTRCVGVVTLILCFVAWLILRSHDISRKETSRRR
jgi:hypothetical protein